VTETQDRFKDVGTAVFFISGAVTLVGTLLTSGLSQDAVNQAIATAQGGQADASDYLTVLQVAFSAFPLVVALLVTFAVVASDGMTGQSKVFGIAVTWGISGFLSSLGDPTTQTQVMARTTGPWYARLLEWGVTLTVAPYTFVLLVQALVVAAGTAITYSVLGKKWRAQDASSKPAH
jgi:branched-subunit amino acid ABC-type transport system permease component